MQADIGSTSNAISAQIFKTLAVMLAELKVNMTTIDLNELENLPKEFLDELKDHNKLFKENRFLENLLNYYPITSLIERIHEYCLKNQIYGYHYTRAIPEIIKKTGLTCRKGVDIRNMFITTFGNNFDEEEKLKIKKAWANHFDNQQQKSRDGLLFFNFTTIALEDYGAEPLLSNYGGEQVYMPIQELSKIGDKIKNFGKPLILKCRLDPKNINTFYEHSWGRIAVSTYHCQVNKEALQDDQDGYQDVDVNPEDIEIIEYVKEKHYR